MAREAVRDLIPDEVRLDNRKAIFSPFCFDMLTGTEAAGVDLILTAPDAEIGAWADLGKVREMWGALRPSRAPGMATTDWGSDIWRLVAAESWLRSLADPSYAETFPERAGLVRPQMRPSRDGGPPGTFLAPTFSGLAKADAAA